MAEELGAPRKDIIRNRTLRDVSHAVYEKAEEGSWNSTAAEIFRAIDRLVDRSIRRGAIDQCFNDS